MKKLVINQKKYKLLNQFGIMIALVVGTITVLLGIYNVTQTAYFANTMTQYNENVHYMNDSIILNGLLLAFGMFVLYLLYRLLRKVDNKYIMVVLCTFIVVSSILWIFYADTPPKSDQKSLVEIAKQFINHNYNSLNQGEYLAGYPYQTGMVLLIFSLFKIFHTTNYIVVEFFNIIFTVLMLVSLYQITKLVFKSEKVNKMFLILCFGLFECIIFNTYIYGNVIALGLSTFALWMTILYLEKKHCFKYLILAAFAIGAAIVFRKNQQVYLIGIVLILLMHCIRTKKIKSLIGAIVIVVVSWLLPKSVLTIVEWKTGKPIEDGIPMISFFYMGMQKEETVRASGWYTGDTVAIYKRNNYDSKKAAEESVLLIKERIHYFATHLDKAYEFYQDKLFSTWIEPTFQAIWISKPSEEYEFVKPFIQDKTLLHSFYDGTLQDILIRYFDINHIIIYVSTGIYLIRRRKEINESKLLLIIIFLGGFAFHLIWETKSIYVFTYYVLLLPIAAASLKEVMEHIPVYFAKKKKMV